jgi:hypothetical protein
MSPTNMIVQDTRVQNGRLLSIREYAKEVKNTRKNKKRVIDVLSTIFYSSSSIEDGDDEGQWALGFCEFPGDDIQLQAINCFKCGNYIDSYVDIHDNCNCRCGNHYRIPLNIGNSDDYLTDDDSYTLPVM